MNIGRRHLGVLRKLHAQLQGTDVRWAITGSLHLALRGKGGSAKLLVPNRF